MKNGQTGKPKTLELLVEGHDGSADAIGRVERSEEVSAFRVPLLFVVGLKQPFAIEYENTAEAEDMATRLRKLGFLCKVWDGPDPKDKVGNRHSN
jgi:hypothetical protein